MKIKKIIAAIGIITAFAGVTAAAENLDIIANGEIVSVNGEIISDRAMVEVSEFERWGVKILANDGEWTLTKANCVVKYSEKSQSLTLGEEEIETDVAPKFDENNKLLPLRAVANSLDMGVGWDEYENAIILMDYEQYLKELEQKNPQLYQLAVLTLRQPEVGVGSAEMTMDFAVADEFSLSLKLSQTQTVKDGINLTEGALDTLKIESTEFNLVLEDVTLDGIYDSATRTMYLKTNAIDKIAEAVPEAREELEKVSKLLPGDAWYKITMQEYMSMLYSAMGIEQVTDIDTLIDSLYGDGMKLGKLVRSISEQDIDSVAYYEYFEDMIEAFGQLIDWRIMSIETIGEDGIRWVVKLDNEIMKEITKQQLAEMEEEFTPEVAAAIDEIALNLLMDMQIIDGVPTKLDMNFTMGEESGETYMSITAKGEFDTDAMPQDIILPDAANLAPLLEALMSIAPTGIV